MIQPALYWRHNQQWSQWLGRTGTVLNSTVVRVAPPGQEIFTPYAYVLVDFGEEKHEFMGTGNDVLQVGDRVRCVLRKISVGQPHELIEYGIKVKKIS